MDNRIILAIISLLTLVGQVSAEDKVTIKDFSISAGETKEVSISLDNDVTYAAFQFDLYLPEGITLTEYSVDKGRVPEGTTLEMNKQEDSSYRFIAAAITQKEITGTSGGIVTIKVTAAENLESGSLTGYFWSIKLSDLDGEGKKYSEMSFPVTVLAPSPLLLGDANEDGKVDATDIADIVNYLTGKPTSTGKFNEQTADVNGDGTVNTADIVKIVNTIMGN